MGNVLLWLYLAFWLAVFYLIGRAVLMRAPPQRLDAAQRATCLHLSRQGIVRRDFPDPVQWVALLSCPIGGRRYNRPFFAVAAGWREAVSRLLAEAPPGSMVRALVPIPPCGTAGDDQAQSSHAQGLRS
jgi:hypothetical protein